MRSQMSRASSENFFAAGCPGRTVGTSIIRRVGTGIDQRGQAPGTTEHRRRLVMPTLLTKREAAEYLRVSERTLDRLRARKLIPSLKVAGAVRFLRQDIEDYLSQQRR
jgi:excisionase family DNA binding protein